MSLKILTTVTKGKSLHHFANKAKQSNQLIKNNNIETFLISMKDLVISPILIQMNNES